MSSMAVLRLLTLVARCALAAVLLTLTKERHRLPRSVRKAWLVLTISAVVFAVTTAVAETLTPLARQGPEQLRLSRVIYQLVYLGNAVVAALVPVLIAVFLANTRALRTASTVIAVVAVGFGVANGVLGAAEEWSHLLDSTRLLDIMAIVGYMVLFSLVLFRRMSIDIYMAGFIAIEAVFLLVLPILEAFYQHAGIDASRGMWQVFQLLQITYCAGQLAVAATLIALIRKGSRPPMLSLGGMI